MIKRVTARTAVAGAGLAIIAIATAAFALGTSGGAAAADAGDRAMVGEARRGRVTVDLAPPIANIEISKSKVPGRPIVVIDPGHGGRDPGAAGVSGSVSEKQLALQLALELRDRLAERGRVRVALTRTRDTYLTLDQRAEIARRLDAGLFVSLHMDSAPNPLARGASVYSLSDVASDAEAARFARSENGGRSGADASEGSVRAILSDLALRSQMNASADLAARFVRKASGRVPMRPEPHRFAAFHVLRRAQVPAVLFEAGYISNADDELMLRSPAHRAKLVAALAQTIEADIAARAHR